MPLRPTSKTLQDLVTEVKRAFGDESGVQITDADIVRWANSGQQEIVTSNTPLKAKATIPTVVGQSVYAFPENIQQVESLHYDNGFLESVPFATAERFIMTNDPDSLESGAPRFWYEWAGELTIWPKPDEVRNLTLYFTASPETLTGVTTQSLSVPDKFYVPLVDYVLSKAYELDEDFQSSGQYEQRFRQALETQGEVERQSQNMTYPVIQETWGW